MIVFVYTAEHRWYLRSRRWHEPREDSVHLTRVVVKSPLPPLHQLFGGWVGVTSKGVQILRQERECGSSYTTSTNEAEADNLWVQVYRCVRAGAVISRLCMFFFTPLYSYSNKKEISPPLGRMEYTTQNPLVLHINPWINSTPRMTSPVRRLASLLRRRVFFSQGHFVDFAPLIIRRLS